MSANKLAVQLYTLRDFTKTFDDFEATCNKIAAIGYPAVQLSAVGAIDGLGVVEGGKQARAVLDRTGLKAVSDAGGWESIRDQTEAWIERAQVLGCNSLMIGGLWTPEYKGLAGYKRWLGELPPVLEKLHGAGIRFAYHNHAHEFQRGESPGSTHFDLLVESSPKTLTFMLDTYWVAITGVPVAKMLRRLAGRIPVIHLKDLEVVEGDAPVMAPVGEGNLDWPDILDAAESGGTEWYCVEQDTCRRDHFDCLRSSLEYLSGKLP